MRIPTHSSGPCSRNSFGKPNSFHPTRSVSPVQPLPPIRPIAPFSRAFLNGGAHVCVCVSVHGFLSSARCLRAAENTDGAVSGRNRDTGVSSISLCLRVGANNGGSMSLRLRRPNATVRLSPAFGDHANIYLPVLAGRANNSAQQRRGVRRNSGPPARSYSSADLTFAIHSLRRSSPPTMIISLAKKRTLRRSRDEQRSRIVRKRRLREIRATFPSRYLDLPSL